MRKGLQSTFFHILTIYFLVLLLNSCATTDCPTCKEKDSDQKRGPIRWNVEFKKPVVNKCTQEFVLSISTDIKPDSVPTAEGEPAVIVTGMPCTDGSTPVYRIPYSDIKEITDMSDPLVPPGPWKPDEPCLCCCRERTGWWIFDKLELRAMIGYRPEPDPVFYPSATGGTLYEPSFINFDRGGSQLFFGFELAGMWSLTKSGNFQLGFMTGVWPIDGSIFVPVAIHPRYTFNQNPNPYEPYCNSWYIYGDLGLPLDFQTEAPIIGDLFDRSRYLIGIGIGYDWAISCSVDFSVDLGIRSFNLPLPPIDCCPDIPNEKSYYYRKSTGPILRFGLTF